jgi:hypothetical protein
MGQTCGSSAATVEALQRFKRRRRSQSAIHAHHTRGARVRYWPRRRRCPRDHGLQQGADKDKCALRVARLPRSTRAAYDEPRLLVPRGAESCVSGSRRRRRHSSRRRWRPWLLRRCRVPAQTATASAGLCRCHTVDSRRDRHLLYVAPTVRTVSNTRSSGIRAAACVAVSSIATRITPRIRAEFRCIRYADKQALRRVSGRAPDQAPLRVRAKDGCLPRPTVAPQGHGDALSVGSRGCRMGGSPTKSCRHALATRQRWRARRR